MKKVKLYLVNQYSAYQIGEQGIYASLDAPKDTLDYKSEILEETEVELPEGITCEPDRTGCLQFWKNDEHVPLYTEYKNGHHVTSFVACGGKVKLVKWEN